MSSRLSARNIYLKNLLKTHVQKELSNSTTVEFSFSLQKKRTVNIPVIIIPQ